MEALGIDLRFIIVTIIGFVCLVWILKKYAFGPVYNMLDERQKNIQGNLDEAQSRRDEMVRLQHEYEQRLAQIEDEARDKIQAAVRDAQAARDEIIAKAHAESETIVARGQQEITRERERAMAEMRNQIADLAVSAAGRLIKQNLDGAGHTKLIDDVIAGLGQSGQRQPGGAQ